MRVLCVDDHADMRGVMKMVIDCEPDMQCVGTLDSANQLIAEAMRVNATVILLDASMRGKDPFEAMAELAAQAPEIRTIIYSAHHDPAFIERARTSGAWGCVSKDGDPDVVVRAVRQVAAGTVFFPPESKPGPP
jgi:DNA-binding NarL/FixJ family response regulator